MTRLLLALLTYVVLIASVALLWDRPDALLGVLSGLALVTLLAVRATHVRIFFFVGAVLGPVGESFAISRGAWSYANTELLIPFWLPLGWGLAAMCLVLVTDAIQGLVGKRSSSASSSRANVAQTMSAR